LHVGQHPGYGEEPNGIRYGETESPTYQRCRLRSARLEISEAVTAALKDLAPNMRLTVLLRYFEEMSYEEIAEILKCSQGTVASRLNRSLKVLARKLA